MHQRSSTNRRGRRDRLKIVRLSRSRRKTVEMMCIRDRQQIVEIASKDRRDRPVEKSSRPSKNGQIIEIAPKDRQDDMHQTNRRDRPVEKSSRPAKNRQIIEIASKDRRDDMHQQTGSVKQNSRTVPPRARGVEGAVAGGEGRPSWLVVYVLSSQAATMG